MKPAGRKQVIILIGPTGVGKSEVGFRLARLVGGEIISADSRLVYKGMDIGTAKPSPSMRGEIPHHLIDVLDPDQEYTCKMFEEEGRRLISEILKRGRVPLVVGGTGLYVRALTHGIFEGPARDDALRASLKNEAEQKGRRVLWERLQSVDSEKAHRIDPENLVRVIRALEVYELTGRPMSELEKAARALDVPYVKIGLTRARQELYRIIDRRVDSMLEAGFEAEVRALVSQGYGASSVVRDTLGYGDLIAYLEGAVTYDEPVRLIKRNTRRFAKRQLTWFRKEPVITWLDITARTDFEAIAQEVLAIIP